MDFVAWYRRNRARTQQLFDLVTDDAYYDRPIPLRHPLVFYEGHLPAFSFNTLVKRALRQPGIDERLEQLFARGIDPSTAPGEDVEAWPSREEVRAFADEADRRVIAALSSADLDVDGDALLDRAEVVYAILEHEAMHQETLLYMWHRLPLEQKRSPSGYSARVEARVPNREVMDVAPGIATLGIDRRSTPFGWDNERPAHSVEVPAFRIDRHDVTNAAFLEFVEAGGYEDARWWSSDDWQWLRRERMSHPLFWERLDGAWYWRGMFDRLSLPLSWPVYVSHAEASAYARWQGARLPTEGEFQRAAFGTSSHAQRTYPWGDAPPDTTHGVFDFTSWDPHPAGSHPEGRSAWGIDDLVGNGWEWTSTVFAPFPGFRPIPAYPEYSADFFDAAHMVMKGASPATARELLRPSFRNWFRPQYPYVYATFRCVRQARS
jgi:ergothioneine biosynthesis protein EgtB